MNTTPTLTDMIAELVASPSVSSVVPHYDMGNQGVIHSLAAWVEGLGYRVTTQELPGHSGKSNLVARLGPERDDGLVLSGHTDTVPYDAHLWGSDPFVLTERDGRLFGLGVTDMKAFLAIAIEAVRAFPESRLKRPITLLATADEESSMDGAKLLLEEGQRPGRCCIIGEPTNLTPIRQHKGILMEAVRLTGQSGHSSDPRLGNSALEGMVAVIEALIALRGRWKEAYRNPAFEVPFPTMNLGHIHGGDNANRICGACELHLDLRPLPGMDLAKLRSEIRECVARVASERGLEWECQALFDGIPAMETPADAHIVRLAEELSGRGAAAVAFGTEGPYFNQLGTETVILGPGNIAQAHQPDEYLDIARIDPMIDILRRFIHRICIADG